MYEQPNPAFQWLLEHPGLGLLFTIFWMLWVAGTLLFICIQLFKYNEREELKKITRQFDVERQERAQKANPFKSVENSDNPYMPKG
jgi:hypothetical protein